jgi:hypothetical protein
MSALNLIKKNLQNDITEYSSKLISFDKVFDEDILDATHEQLRIISIEIENLENMMMNCILRCDEVHYTQTGEYSELATKMLLFHDKEKEVQQDLDILISSRDNLYKVWKDDYIRNAEHFAEAQYKLRQFNDIENSLTKLVNNKVKANNNIILLVYIHSQVNKLLTLANINKEKSPYNAFKVAWNHQLITDNVYDMLKM